MSQQETEKAPGRISHQILIFLVGSVLLPACSLSSGNYLRKELANQGPMVLSLDNPYLAPNLLLSEEIKASPLMEGFINHRGIPEAIEVSSKWLRPFRLYFFYLADREAYLLEERSGQWLVRGPETIPEKILFRFANVKPGLRKPMLAGVTTKDTRPGQYQNRSASTGDSKSHFTQETPAAESSTWAEPNQTAYPTPGEPLRGASPPSSRRRTLSPSGNQMPKPVRTEIKGNVSVSPSGDIRHRVEFPGETLRIVAGWFTDSPDNAERIARINGISNPDILHLNQEVRIPRYLLKRTDSLPESEIRRYLENVEMNSDQP